MKNFTTTDLLRLLTAFDPASLDLAKRAQLLLDGLVTLGFHSARFYLKVDGGEAPKSDVIQLVAYAYRTPPSASLLGTKIAFSDTTIYRNGDVEAGYSIGSPADHNDVTWPDDLALNDTFWIDLLVSNPITREIYGLLAVSWSGSRELLTEEAVSALRLVSSRIGTSITERSAFISSVREGVENTLHVNQHTAAITNDTQDQIIQFFQRSFTSTSVSCFAYDYVTGRVIKLREFVNARHCSDDMLPEDYLVGVSLFGKAFINQELCYIPNFPLFVDTHPTAVPAPVLEYYRTTIGEIQS